MSPYIYLSLSAVFLLVISPPVAYLLFGWSSRRCDLEEGLSDEAITTYFRAFHNKSVSDPRGEFRRYYAKQYGKGRFILWTAHFVLISGLSLCWVFHSYASFATAKPNADELPLLAVFSIAGAFLWILYDEITRWYSNRLSPADVFWWSMRLVIAVPMGYATKALVAESIAPAIAFYAGAFPLSQILSISRRIAAQRLGLKDSDENEISELQSLQGIDMAKASAFLGEDITTVLQLAYCDPIKLTIRTGFEYSYISDCICQALLWLYVEKDKAVLRKSGLRSAYEVYCLQDDLSNGSPEVRTRAEGVLKEAAKAAGYEYASFAYVVAQVAEDPYVLFLYQSWTGNNENMEGLADPTPSQPATGAGPARSSPFVGSA